MASNQSLALNVPASISVLVLTGAQIRAGRALLKWTAAELSERCGVSYAAIQRAEAVDGMPNMHTRNLAAIKSALESGGIEFIDGHYSGGGGPGVRVRAD